MFIICSQKKNAFENDSSILEKKILFVLIEENVFYANNTDNSKKAPLTSKYFQAISSLWEEKYSSSS